MGYVIAALLVLLLVGGFVFFLVTNATKKSNVSDAGDPGADRRARTPNAHDAPPAQSSAGTSAPPNPRSSPAACASDATRARGTGGRQRAPARPATSA